MNELFDLLNTSSLVYWSVVLLMFVLFGLVAFFYGFAAPMVLLVLAVIATSLVTFDE